MARLLPLLCSLFLATTAQAQRRAVMENLATTGTSIFISSTQQRVGIGTAAPVALLDVNGAASIGFSVSKTTVDSGGGVTMAANADLTVSGPTGYITAGASVTASAFFGHGAALTGLPVAQTTVTYNLSGATTETTNFKVCYGTGTLVLSAGTQVQVVYSGDITNSGAAGTYCIINFLQDGAFILPATNAIGMGKSNNAAAGGSGNATTVRVFPSPGAGSHSWCISMISPFGTTCTFSTGGAYGNQFSVTELR